MIYLLLFLSTAWAGNVQTQCGQVEVPRHWEYCRILTEGSTNHDVVYHLHGLGENSRAWAGPIAGQVQNQWDQMGAQPPTVITVSFGPEWLLTTKNSTPESGLYEVFTQTVLPYLEAQVVPPNPGRRILFGYSMGGFNAAQILLRQPGLFSRAVLACPALAKVSPFASDAEIESYIQRNHADRALVKVMLQVVKKYYPDDDAYEKDSPLKLAQNLTEELPPTHLSCGAQDDFGFYEGALALKVLMEAKGEPVTWQSLQGGHCTLDPVAIAQFLLVR